MTETGSGARRQARARWLLRAGAAVGIGAAVASLLGRPPGDGLSQGQVARVNGVPIRTQEYQRAVAAVDADRRTPLDEADRRYVLDRLIDEELLVQYGMSLGLARSDRRIRSDFVSAVIAAQVASVDGSEPSGEEVRAEMGSIGGPPVQSRTSTDVLVGGRSAGSGWLGSGSGRVAFGRVRPRPWPRRS